MPDLPIDDCGVSVVPALAEPARPAVRDLFGAEQSAASGPHRAPVRVPTPLRPDRRALSAVHQAADVSELACGRDVPMPDHHRWDGPSMGEQSSEVDVGALATLLARVAQTTLEVVITLIDDQAETSRCLPTTRLIALADEFDWVGVVIRRQVESTKLGGGS